VKEYNSTEISIQYAMLDMWKSYSDASTRPDHIKYDGLKVKTGHWIEVPENFTIKLEFLSEPNADQGADISVKDGFVILGDGSKVKLLRIWHDPKYEPVVEYSGYSKAKQLIIYNVYKVERNGKIFEEKWTNNAGMLVERSNEDECIFKCSSGRCDPPNFESIVFRVSVRENIS
jgi:hypothetical protein